MELLIKADRLGKTHRHDEVLSSVSFELSTGQVLGLLGHNGAGKSTLIKSILGAQRFDGELSVFGFHPDKDRVKIMRDLACISDVAVLPGWMKVEQLIKYMSGVHPSFDRQKAYQLLEETDIRPGKCVHQLSKGMKMQLHLALVMATDVRVLILDEPTLGLDLMYREKFYQSLMSWFRKGERALIIASHEVAEIEHMLTDILVLKKGKAVLQGSIAELKNRFSTLCTTSDNLNEAMALKPVYHRAQNKDHILLFKDVSEEQLHPLGQIVNTGLSDIFIAKQLEVGE
ncbi:ABC transporter ATP-binding protein [Photobacterium sp. J15]|uniref:ABC transporter ATP-binding protein n=1 Tax=Photobacterium sp. J15 TaxID=265901 RepID=UPI0007E3F9EA|nr:ABC transporter ATP-binding protein [Photobacterium sp. J15]